MEGALVNQRYLLQKIPGKGGWTYVDLPQVTPDSKAPFGWMKVKGRIDSIEIKNYHLMPFGQGKLFLPVKAEIRKKIKKEAGDFVHVVLYPDNDPVCIPDEMLSCLQDEPEAFRFFHTLTEREKGAFIKRVYAAKTDETRASRMAKMIDRLLKQETLGK